MASDVAKCPSSRFWKAGELERCTDTEESESKIWKKLGKVKQDSEGDSCLGFVKKYKMLLIGPRSRMPAGVRFLRWRKAKEADSGYFCNLDSKNNSEVIFD